MSSEQTNLTRRSFDSRKAMAEKLADDVAHRLRNAIASRGHASLSVGGGRFPKPFLQLLAKKKLRWDKVWVALGDERWVDASHEASNERLVRENLLQGDAAQARFVGLKTDHREPADGLGELEHRLDELPERFDVTVVGMGEDGHTASLFPSALPAELAQGLHPRAGENIAVLNPTVSDVPRVSLTLPRLTASHWLVIAAPGEGKLRTLEEAVAGHDVYEMPVRALFTQQDVPVEFWWAP